LNFANNWAFAKGGKMKKLLIATLMLASFGFIDLWQTSNTAEAATLGAPQVRIQIGQQRRYRDRYYRNRNHYPFGERVGYGRTFTRDVRVGYRLYRETYQMRYLPNGRTQTFLISRVRLN
jgi:hypothetical protein